MKFFWTHIWKSRAYRHATADERRMIEVRFTAARALRAKRRSCGMTQAELARRIGVTQPTLSKIERASGHAALDIVIRGLIALDCDDDELANAFHAGRNPDVQRLRRRAAEKFFPKPLPRVILRP